MSSTAPTARSTAPALRGDGSFDAPGRFLREHPGPIRLGEAPNEEAAGYSGSLRQDLLTLTVTRKDQETLGPFALRRGRAGRVAKCR